MFVGHPGGYHGFTSAIEFSPQDNCGSIVLCNGRAEVDELAVELATMIVQIQQDGAPAAIAVPQLVEWTEPPPNFAEILGEYASEPLGWSLRFEWRVNRLVLVDRGTSGTSLKKPAQEVVIGLESTDDPLVLIIGGGGAVGEQARFFRGTDNTIELVNITGLPFTRRFPG
jgi:hypothetical protein